MGGYDHIVPGLPVDGGIDGMFVSSEQRVEYAEKFGCVTARGGRVGLNQANDLIGVDNEYRPDGVGDSPCVHIGSILVIKPGGTREFITEVGGGECVWAGEGQDREERK